ncbi:MAG: hypothetical protein ACJAZM_003003 [Cyclobacteriaceae bacterium]|jgi:hypothetical protein
MKRVTLITCFILSIFYISEAQQVQDSLSASKLVIYGDFGPNLLGVPASINVEGLFLNKKKIQLYARAGFGYGVIFFGPTGPGGLGALSFLVGGGKHHFEVDGGVFVGQDSYDGDTFLTPIADIGYRFQKPGGGLFFKGKLGIVGFSIGLGYAFKNR